MIAHLTPLEAPIVWFAFAAGIALGAVGMWLTLSMRKPMQDKQRS
ncbi:MAG: hypothetical protein AB8H80_05180 [Planctomycetota bacterium]